MVTIVNEIRIWGKKIRNLTKSIYSNILFGKLHQGSWVTDVDQFSSYDTALNDMLCNHLTCELPDTQKQRRLHLSASHTGFTQHNALFSIHTSIFYANVSPTLWKILIAIFNTQTVRLNYKKTFAIKLLSVVQKDKI